MKGQKHDKITLSAKIKILRSKELIGSYASQDEFNSVNNVLKEYDDTKEAI